MFAAHWYAVQYHRRSKTWVYPYENYGAPGASGSKPDFLDEWFYHDRATRVYRLALFSHAKVQL